jgi:hypothetical protein
VVGERDEVTIIPPRQGRFTELVARGGIFTTLYQMQFEGEAAEGEGTRRSCLGEDPTHTLPAAQ